MTSSLKNIYVCACVLWDTQQDSTRYWQERMCDTADLHVHSRAHISGQQTSKCRFFLFAQVQCAVIRCKPGRSSQFRTSRNRGTRQNTSTRGTPPLVQQGGRPSTRAATQAGSRRCTSRPTGTPSIPSGWPPRTAFGMVTACQNQSVTAGADTLLCTLHSALN